MQGKFFDHRSRLTADLPVGYGVDSRKAAFCQMTTKAALPPPPQSFTYFWKLFRSFISLGGITARQ
jgi:hypothetical protein